MYLSRWLAAFLLLNCCVWSTYSIYSWVFQNPSNILLTGVASNPVSVRMSDTICAVASAGGQNQIIYFSFNKTSRVIGTSVLYYLTNSNAGAAQVELVSYPSNVTYGFATMPGNANLFIHRIVNASFTQSTLALGTTVLQLLLDPHYPWLYAISEGRVQLLNISNPLAVAVISSQFTAQKFYPSLTNAAAINGSRLLVGDVSGSTSGVVVFDYSQSVALVPTISRLTDLTGWKVKSVSLDPTSQFLGLTRDNATNVTMPGSAIYSYNTSFLNNSLVSAIPFYNPGVSITFFNQTVLILSRPQTTNVTMFSSYFCPYYPAAGQCAPFPGELRMPFGTPDLDASSWTWIGNRVFIASNATNTIYSLDAALTLDSGAVDLNALVNASSTFQASNYTSGSFARLLPLSLTVNNKLYVDASLSAGVSVTTNSLNVGDGDKVLVYNNVMLTVTSNTSATETFQVYNNITKSWTGVTSFSQMDLINGNVRVVANSAVRQNCSTGNSSVFPYDATVFFQASDVWGRSFPSSQSFSYEVTCCSALSLSANNTVNQTTGACNLPVAGMYTLANGSGIAPCPIGTFNPNTGAGDGAKVCRSCPSGSVTLFSGATSISQCICSNCVMSSTLTGSSNGSSLKYYWPTSGTLTAQNSLFYTVKVKGEGPAYIVLSTSASAPTNNSAISDSVAAYYQISIGEGSNSMITVTNVSSSGMLNVSLSPSAQRYSSVAQKAISSDYWTTVWVYYVSGTIQVGLLNPELEDNKPGVIATGNIYSVAQNALGTLPVQLTPFPYVTATFSPSNPSALVRRIGLGFASSNVVSYVDGYSFYASDLYNSLVVEKPNPLPWSASFPSLDYTEFLYTLIPGSAFFAFSTTPGMGVNATWFDASLTTYDFGGVNAEANSLYLGSVLDIVINSTSGLDFTSWPSVRSFNGSALASNRIYLKALVNQSQFPSNSLQLKFSVSTSAVKIPVTLTGVTLNISLPQLDPDFGLHIGSWKLENSSQSNSPSLRCQSSTFTYSSMLYVFGGANVNSLSYYNDFYAYDTVQNTWSLVSPSSSVPTQRALTGFAYIPKLGCALLYGGYGSVLPLFKTDMWCYSPVINVFVNLTVQCNTTASNCIGGTANFGQLVTLSDNSTVAMFGGASASYDSNKLYLYSAGSWIYANNGTAKESSQATSVSSGLFTQAAQNVPSGRQMHAFASGRNNVALLFGGQHLYNSELLLNDLWQYDSNVNMWSLLAAPISEANYLIPPARLTFLSSKSYAPLPRNLSNAVSDGFGNMYVFGGISNEVGSRNDLWLFNQNLNEWMLIAGNADGVTPGASLNTVSVGVGIASALNTPPASYGNSLFIVPQSADGRYYKLYLVSTCQTLGDPVQVWSLSVFVKQSAPKITASSLSFDLTYKTFAVINYTNFNVISVDSARSEVNVRPRSTNLGVYKNLSSSLAISQWTMQDLYAGLQVGFYPNLSSVISASSADNNSTYYSTNLAIDVVTPDDTSTVYISMVASCSLANSVLPYCQCGSGYVMSDSGQCVATQGASPSSSSGSSVNIIIIAASAGGAALVVAVVIASLVIARGKRRRRRELEIEEEKLRQQRQMGTYEHTCSTVKSDQFTDINLPLNLPSSANIVNQAFGYAAPPTTSSSNFGNNTYTSITGSTINANNLKPRSGNILPNGISGYSNASTVEQRKSSAYSANLEFGAVEERDNPDPFNMKTQVVSSRPIIAFPAFLAVNSASGMRKIEKIAEGGFAVLYKGQLLDTSITDGAYQNVHVAMKSFKFRAPKPKRNGKKDDDSEPKGEPASKEAEKPTSGTMGEAVLPPSEDAIADMENEASVMYALQSCPNVVKLVAVSKEPELMLAMKLYLDSVGHMLHSSKSQHYVRALQFAKGSHPKLGAIFSYDLCNAVLAMHLTGIVHLDIKPSNLLLEAVRPENNMTGFPYRAILCDFGLARVVSETNAVKGRRKNFATGVSINYAAPEAFSLVRFMDSGTKLGADALQKLDIYSVSASVYELMTRKIPFEGLTLKEMEESLAKGMRPPMNDFNPNNLPVPIFNVRTGAFSAPGENGAKQKPDENDKPAKFTVTCQKDVLLLFEMSKIIQQSWAQFAESRPDIAAVYDAVCEAIKQYANAE